MILFSLALATLASSAVTLPASAQDDAPPAADEQKTDDRAGSSAQTEVTAGAIGVSGISRNLTNGGVQRGSAAGSGSPGRAPSPNPSQSGPSGGSGPVVPPADSGPACQPYECNPPKPSKTDPREPCLPAKNREALISCVAADVDPQDEVGAFEVTKRVAWALRSECAGLLLKPTGAKIIAWRGASFSASRIAYPNGHIFKILSDVGAGGKNAPAWEDEDCVEPKRYVPAINPTLP